MSRIHEALLRAEKERAISAEIAMPPSVSEADLRASIEANPESGLPGAHSIQTVPESALSGNGHSSDFRRADWKPDHDRLLFFEPQKHVAAVEGFRVLRSRLARAQADRNIRSILVTSACPGEGKTFIAANLAMAFAQQPGKRALIVDADLRRPSLHKCFGAAQSPGLTEYLNGAATESSIVQYGDHAGLFLVTAGQQAANPAELLNGERMHSFLSHIVATFDWVVFDSPPATGLADSMILSEMADGVLLVVSEGTPIKMVQLLAKEFRQRPVLGTVFNRAAVRKTYYYRGYSYNGEGEDKK